jgi:hypothetical protein
MTLGRRLRDDENSLRLDSLLVTWPDTGPAGTPWSLLLPDERQKLAEIMIICAPDSPEVLLTYGALLG